MRNGRVRLVMEVEPKLLEWIKSTAAEKNQTMACWVMEAIIEKQIKDKVLGF